MLKIMLAKPVVKWVGGKRQLLQELLKRLPLNYNNYYEPFIGGGALYFNIIQQQSKHKFFISDLNNELINMYKIICNKPYKLIYQLQKYKNNHNKEQYYQLRELYNNSSKKGIISAARFIYFNKTGFNGLYRVNKNGGFNVPMGKYTNPDIVQKDNIIIVSSILKRTNIQTCSFEYIKPKKNDFIYLDPPYYPLTKTAHFTNYTNNGFSEIMQLKLKKYIDNLTKNGVYVMMSNSDTEFIHNLYKEYNIEIVQATRRINSNAKNRGNINEIIVRNYS